MAPRIRAASPFRWSAFALAAAAIALFARACSAGPGGGPPIPSFYTNTAVHELSPKDFAKTVLKSDGLWMVRARDGGSGGERRGRGRAETATTNDEGRAEGRGKPPWGDRSLPRSRGWSASPAPALLRSSGLFACFPLRRRLDFPPPPFCLFAPEQIPFFPRQVEFYAPW